MSDEIKLTVETGAPSIQAAPEQAIAQAAEEAAKVTAPITLTLNPSQVQQPPQAAQEQKPPVQPQEVRPAFTPQEQKMIEDFAAKIDVTDTNLVFSYGASAQQQIASFSDSALKNVQTKDLGEVGDMIGSLVTELKGFTVDEEESGGIFGFFKKSVDKLQLMKNRYDHAEVNVNRIVDGLESHQVQLLKDIATLDQLYEQNLVYFKELSMYIEAGRIRLKQVREADLAQAQQRAAASGLPEDAQAANDLAAKIDRFEKKIHDLELTRNISIQMAPQIRLLQNSNQLMAEKIQSSLVNTIPLWKSQMVLALGMQHTQDAMEAQRAVTDLTNELLRKNAQKLRTATVETARESERGIVDIETLKQTNASLIQTMDEVLAIQQEGREKRRAAEKELAAIEGELRAKLLDIRQ
ncbi:MAG TPA: toxic anion resistance protein [Candidatus Excrementavichristensenella intestinipullorum]|nr:toxic anion resistance protein [Candidatus Excrementavichristensenella intestinipullorum]